ncbi:MAG: flagellar hook basal-body protein [Deltaproteobacteria bacterium]|nr:flagellar hook basal-body protein [Deltaproteobacteria bacterium]
MASGIYSALSGAMADVRRMEVVSHNLANTGTSAFNQLRTAFEAIQGEAKTKEITFAAPTQTIRDVRSGPLRATGNPLDLALSEGVYMTVASGEKTAYMRGATLVLKPDGTLSTEEGFTVLGENNAIRLPLDARSIMVGPDGTVMADGQESGKIRLVEFNDQQALVHGSDRSFVDPGGAGAMPSTAAQPIATGYLEQSNIDMVRGMTEMIAAHRNYDATIKALETFSSIEKRAARGMGRV